jgi:hypothetical protein
MELEQGSCWEVNNCSTGQERFITVIHKTLSLIPNTPFLKRYLLMLSFH